MSISPLLKASSHTSMPDPSPQSGILSKSAEAWAHPVLRHLIFEKIDESGWELREALVNLVQVNWACFYEAVPLLYREARSFKGWKVLTKDASAEDIEFWGESWEDEYLWVGLGHSMLHYMEQAKASEERMQLYLSKVKKLVLPFSMQDLKDLDIAQHRRNYPNLAEIEYIFLREAEHYDIHPPVTVTLRRVPGTNDFNAACFNLTGSSFSRSDYLLEANPYRWTRLPLKVEEIVMTSEQEDHDVAVGLCGWIKKLEDPYCNFTFDGLKKLEIGGSGRLDWGDLEKFLNERDISKLEVLDITSSSILQPETLDTIVQRCPNLEALHIRPMGSAKEHKPMSSMAGPLARLRRLRHLTLPFDLSLIRWKCPPAIKSFKPSTLDTPKLFADVHNLDTISFQLTRAQTWHAVSPLWSVQLVSYMLGLVPLTCTVDVNADGDTWGTKVDLVPVQDSLSGPDQRAIALNEARTTARERAARDYLSEVRQTMEAMRGWIAEAAESEAKKGRVVGWSHVGKA